MAARDYESQPQTNALGIDGVILGLAQDLVDLRQGKISNQDAIARSALGKQIFNGFRIYLNGQKTLAGLAKTVPASVEGGGA